MKNLKIFIYGALALVSVVVVRCLQIALLTNPENGFFYDGSEALGTTLTAVVIAIIAVSAVLCLFAKTEDTCLIPKKNTVLGVAALLAGAAQLCEPFTGVASLENTPTAMNILHTVLILATGLYFCYLGIINITGGKPRYSLSVIPVVAWLLRLVVTFISFTGMSNISDNLYDVLALGSTAIFLLMQGKALCSIPVKLAANFIYILGMVSTLFTAVAVLPRFIVALLGIREYLHLQVDSPLSLFFTALYAVIYLVVISKKNEAV